MNDTTPDDALAAIEALTQPPAGRHDDLRRFSCRVILRAAALYNAGCNGYKDEIQALISVWAHSPDGFPVLGLSPEDVDALIEPPSTK